MVHENMEDFVTGDVETFIGDIEENSKIIDWEDESNDFRKVSSDGILTMFWKD